MKIKTCTKLNSSRLKLNIDKPDIGPDCVKTQKNSACEKIDLLERPLRDFLSIGNGHPTHENFVFLRFYTASAKCGRGLQLKVLGN